MELSSPDDLTTDEGLAFVDSLADFARPVLVLSGGEPLFRDDIFQIAAHAHERELPVALATNGTLVDESIAAEISRVGVRRVSISFDGADAETHDTFRGIAGSFEQALAGMRRIQAAGVPVQINSTIAKHNLHQIDDLFALALQEDAVALHIFMLVPVGCGVQIADEQMIEAEEYERALTRLYELSRDGRIEVKATCAPHFYRIARQMAAQDRKRGAEAPAPAGHPGHGHGDVGSRGARPGMPGCLAGTGVCFVSHKGEVFPCGYLPVKCGDIREQSIGEIWTGSPVFLKLRDPGNLKGKCGICEYKRICMGCRARAFADTGDYLAEEPYCTYVPRKQR
jgi:radical SAM protein with 4Fe4S-binding SPASM domain